MSGKWIVITMIALMATSAILAGLGSPSPQEMGDDPAAEAFEPIPGGARGYNLWKAQTIGTDTMKFDGLEIGDPDNDGQNEVVACGLASDVILMEYNAESKSWGQKTLWTGAGELISPAIGDFDPDHEGNEIAVCGAVSGAEDDGSPGTVVEIYLENGTWKAEEMFQDTAFLHAITVGDADNDGDDEVVIGGFSHNGFIIERVNGSWNTTKIASDDHNLRTVVVDDFDPDLPDNEVVFASKTGKCIQVYLDRELAPVTGEYDESAWKQKTLYQEMEGLGGIARVTVGDLDPTVEGKELVVAGDSFNATMLTRNSDGTWTPTVLHSDTDKLRGVWIGEFDGRNSVRELAIAGYSGNVTVVHWDGSAWQKELIWQDVNRDHMIKVGDVDPTHEGNEVFTCGYSLNTTMIYLDWSPPAVSDAWKAVTIGKDTMKFDGLDVGDADNDGRDEVVACGLASNVILMEYDQESESWGQTTIWTGGGELLSPAVGDFDPEHYGNEIAVVGTVSGSEDDGAPGTLVELYLDDEENWVAEEIFTDSALIHAVTVGDADNDGEDEIVCGGFSFKGFVVEKVDGNWTSTQIAEDDHNLRTVVVADFDPDWDGNEVVYASKTGKCLEVYWNGTEWKQKSLFQEMEGEGGIARVTVGDLDPSSDGEEIVVGGDSFKATMLTRNADGTWTPTVLYTDTDKLRGVWIGEFDSRNDVLELAVAGYSGNVVEIYWDTAGSKWVTEQIWKDINRDHMVKIGDVDPTHKGNEVFTCGYSLNTTMIYLDTGDEPVDPGDFDLSRVKVVTEVAPGDTAAWTLSTNAVDGFDDDLNFRQSGIPEGYTGSFLVPEDEDAMGTELPQGWRPYDGIPNDWMPVATAADIPVGVSVVFLVDVPEDAEPGEVTGIKVTAESVSHDDISHSQNLSLTVKPVKEVPPLGKDGLEEDMAEGDVIEFTFGGDEISVELRELGDGSAFLVISGGVGTKPVGVGESVHIDLDDDGEKDITIKLVSIDGDIGSFELSLYEEEEEAASILENPFFILGLLIIIIIIVAIAAMAGGKKPKDEPPEPEEEKERPKTKRKRPEKDEDDDLDDEYDDWEDEKD